MLHETHNHCSLKWLQTKSKEGGREGRRKEGRLRHSHRAEQPKETLYSHLGGSLDGIMVLLHSREVTRKQHLPAHPQPCVSADNVPLMFPLGALSVGTLPRLW